MKKESVKPLMVEVSGGTAPANSLVFGLVQTTLREAGFGNLKVNHPFGDGTSADGDEMSSLLGVLHVAHPKLFQERIEVKQHLPERAIGYEHNAPTHLVESFTYGVGEIDGVPHSKAEVYRTEMAVETIRRMNEKYPRDEAVDRAEDHARNVKFLKYMENPQTRAMLEDLFDEKIDEKDLEELRREVEAAGQA